MPTASFSLWRACLAETKAGVVEWLVSTSVDLRTPGLLPGLDWRRDRTACEPDESIAKRSWSCNGAMVSNNSGKVAVGKQSAAEVTILVIKWFGGLQSLAVTIRAICIHIDKFQIAYFTVLLLEVTSPQSDTFENLVAQHQ